MKRRLFLFLILLALWAVIPLSASQRVLINTGHTQAINDFAQASKQNLLFTAGNDGTLRVWENRRLSSVRGSLLYKLQISHLPIVKIAVHPTKPLVAMIETDRINTFHLSVWNYRSAEEIFSHKIKEIPLFLKYSPRGTYLIYGKTEWDSLTFLDSQTGSLETVLDSGFGIVSDVFLSSSEKTLLTYSPSGLLRYWNLETGEEKTSFSTIGDLVDIQFADNGVYMVGTKGKSVYLVNLVNGSVEAQETFESIRSIDLDEERDRIVLYFTENSRPRFQSFRIEQVSSSRFFTPTQKSVSAPDFAVPPLLLQDSRVLFSRDDGSLYTQSIYDAEPSVYASSVLLKVSGLSFSDSTIVVASPSTIMKLSSPLFGTAATETMKTDQYNFHTERFDNPLGNSDVGILNLGGDTFFIYPKAGVGNSMYLFDGADFTPLNTQLTGPVEEASLYEGNILLLEKSGILRIIDPVEDRQVFNYSSFGLQSAVESYQNNILLSRNRTEFINTTLLRINPETSETVPIPDRNLLTFHLAYDNTTRILYSLGFEQRRNNIRTVLKQHQGRNYSRISTLLSYPGEDSGATLAIDPGTSRVFTSLGYGDVHMFTWNGFSTMEKVEHIPRELYTHNGRLYSLNGDSSISIWDTSSGKLQMTLNVFKDLSWGISFADGNYFATEDAREWIHTVSE